MLPRIRVKIQGNWIEGCPVAYTFGDLPNIRIINGYIAAGRNAEPYLVERADQLHQSIAMYLIGRDAAIQPLELRFLRKLMQLTQDDLAEILGVSRQSIIRYESNVASMAKGSDILIRIAFAFRVMGAKQRDELVRSLVSFRLKSPPAGHDAYFALTPDGWYLGDPERIAA